MRVTLLLSVFVLIVSVFIHPALGDALIVDEFNSTVNMFNGERGVGYDMQDERLANIYLYGESASNNPFDYMPKYSVSTGYRVVDYQVHLGTEWMGGSERISWRQEYMHYFYNTVKDENQYANGYTYWYSALFDTSHYNQDQHLQAIRADEGVEAVNYDYLCFWVKGAEGGEDFSVKMDIGIANANTMASNFLYEEWRIKRLCGRSTIPLYIGTYLSAGEVTTEWQMAKIPLRDFIGSNRRDQLVSDTPYGFTMPTAGIDRKWITAWEHLTNVMAIVFDFGYHPRFVQRPNGDNFSENGIDLDDAEWLVMRQFNNTGTIWVDHMFFARDEDFTPTVLPYTNNKLITSVDIIMPVFGQWTRNSNDYSQSFTADNSVTFSFNLSSSATVTIDVYDTRGNRIRNVTPSAQNCIAGNNTIIWDMKNEFDDYINSSIYIAVITATGSPSGGTVEETVRMSFLIMK